MKRVFMLILLISFILVGCNNNDNGINYNNDENIGIQSLSTIKPETLEFFSDIDFSNYSITSVKKLLYDNGDADYEYGLLTNIENGLMINIIEISKKFSDYNFSAGGTSVLSGRSELSIHLEDGEESIHINIFGGSIQGEFYAITFSYRNVDDEYYITYCYAFPTEIENIYNLIIE